MSKKDLFQILREKTPQKPDARFDREFWAKFQNEFKAPQPQTRWFWQRLDLRWLIPVGASCLLALVLWKQDPGNRATTLADSADTNEMISNVALLKDMDLFIGEKDLEQPVDYSALSDDEWNLLLKGT